MSQNGRVWGAPQRDVSVIRDRDGKGVSRARKSPSLCRSEEQRRHGSVVGEWEGFGAGEYIYDAKRVW